MFNLNEFIQRETVIPNIKRWGATHSIKGLYGLPVNLVIKTMIGSFKNYSLMTRASAITFNLILAFFPFTIFLLTTLPYFNIENAIDLLEQSMDGLVPKNVESVIFGLIDDTVKPRGGLLSIGFILAMFFASNGMIALMNAFDLTSITRINSRPPLRKRMIAIFLTMLMVTALIVSVTSIVLSGQILELAKEYIHIDYITEGLILGFRWIPVILLIFLIISIIYRFGPSFDLKIPFFSIGGVTATLGCIVVSLLISYLVNNFTNYNRIYGSIGTIIALMIWLQYNIVVILMGYELNVAILFQRKQHKLDKLKQRSIL